MFPRWYIIKIRNYLEIYIIVSWWKQLSANYSNKLRNSERYIFIDCIAVQTFDRFFHINDWILVDIINKYSNKLYITILNYVISLFPWLKLHERGSIFVGIVRTLQRLIRSCGHLPLKYQVTQSLIYGCSTTQHGRVTTQKVSQSNTFFLSSVADILRVAK